MFAGPAESYYKPRRKRRETEVTGARESSNKTSSRLVDAHRRRNVSFIFIFSIVRTLHRVRRGKLRDGTVFLWDSSREKEVELSPSGDENYRLRWVVFATPQPEKALKKS